MTVSPKSPSEHDQQLLSAYLDGALSTREKEMLEQRLAHEPALRAELEHLRDTVALLRDLPRLKAPRDFTLDPQVYARIRPWWKRLFTLEVGLQFTGALGAAAAMILIASAVLFAQNSTRESGSLSEKPLVEQSAPDQASQVALQTTATALRRTLSYDDTALTEKTRISFAGEEFQSTMAAQSAYHATRPSSTTLLPTLNGAPEAETGILSADSVAESGAGAEPAAQQALPAAPLEVEETTMMDGEVYAPAAVGDSAGGAAPPPEPNLAAPPAGFAPVITGSPAAEDTFREGDDHDEREVLEALDNEPAITLPPAEVAAVGSETPESTVVEKRGTSEDAADTSPEWLLAVAGIVLLVLSGVLFGIGRRIAR